MKSITPLFSLVLFSLTPLASAKPDFEINIGTLHGQLRYAPEAFAVKPDSTIRLNFENSDEMIHNLILAKGDGKTIDKLAESALKLGEKGMEMGFVPKDSSILTSIGLILPGKKGSVEFTSPKEKGDYPYVCTFPGHSLTMRGIMKVVDDPNAIDFSQTKTVSASTTPRNGVIEVGTEPRVIRVHVAGIDSGRSIAVGLPGGVNYLFDAEKLMVRTGWTGAFINVTRDRRGRGGGLCTILGEKFEAGAKESPLRLGSPDKAPETKFLGYSRKGNPTFIYEVDGVRIEQTATGHPAKKGLTLGFRVEKPKSDMFYLVDPEGLLVSSTAGKWHSDKGYVQIPAQEASEFFISLERK
jgi:plastocyanin